MDQLQWLGLISWKRYCVSAAVIRADNLELVLVGLGVGNCSEV